MLLESKWRPRLGQGEGTPSERLAAAIAEDVMGGLLESGDRLPAHRDLADRLKVGVGTVTKAYGLLERRGIVRTVSGSGTFVALLEARRGPMVDLSRNAPPAALTERLLVRTLGAVAKRVDAGLFNRYPPIGGHGEHRRLLARWFRRLGGDFDPARILVTAGAHHAVSIAMHVACGQDGTLLMEAHTYPGAIALGRHQRTRINAVEIDGEGIRPDALERAASALAGRKALYVTPTMHNPTTATMGRVRREEIVAVCRQHDVVIIEDDVYSLAGSTERPTLASLAPERTFYANSLSKTLNPSLRIGGLVPPEGWQERAETTLQATAIMVSPLSCAVMEQWLTDGTADALVTAIRDESAVRLSLARTLFGERIRAPREHGYHVWLPMASARANMFEQLARASGVLVTPPGSTAADPDAVDSGIRVCIGAPAMNDLRAALSVLARIDAELSGGAPARPIETLT